MPTNVPKESGEGRTGGGGGVWSHDEIEGRRFSADDDEEEVIPELEEVWESDPWRLVKESEEKREVGGVDRSMVGQPAFVRSRVDPCV